MSGWVPYGCLGCRRRFLPREAPWGFHSIPGFHLPTSPPQTPENPLPNVVASYRLLAEVWWWGVHPLQALWPCLLGSGPRQGQGSVGAESEDLSSSCTSCLSTRWPCFWCTEQHTCVSNESQCQASPNPMVSQWARASLPCSILFYGLSKSLCLLSKHYKNQLGVVLLSHGRPKVLGMTHDYVSPARLLTLSGPVSLPIKWATWRTKEI